MGYNAAGKYGMIRTKQRNGFRKSGMSMDERQHKYRQNNQAGNASRQGTRKNVRRGSLEARRRRRERYRRRRRLLFAGGAFAALLLIIGIIFAVKAIFFKDPGYYRPEGWDTRQESTALPEGTTSVPEGTTSVPEDTSDQTPSAAGTPENIENE